MPVEFEGHKTTERTVDMIHAARRIWHASPDSNGKHHPPVAQGGYNRGGVSASGGTHDKDAVDFDTSYLSNMENRFWEKCCRLVGFKAWWRPRLLRGNGTLIWNEHCHCIPEGGDISAVAERQVKAFHNQRDGLRSNRHDPTIGGLAWRTWEKYRALHPPKPPVGKVRISGKLYTDVPYLSVDQLREDWLAARRSVSVFWVQRWLTKRGHYKAARDGIRGPVTSAAWRRFVTVNKLNDPGLPNLAAVQLLGKRCKTTKPIRRR